MPDALYTKINKKVSLQKTITYQWNKQKQI